MPNRTIVLQAASPGRYSVQASLQQLFDEMSGTYGGGTGQIDS